MISCSHWGMFEGALPIVVEVQTPGELPHITMAFVMAPE